MNYFLIFSVTALAFFLSFPAGRALADISYFYSAETEQDTQDACNNDEEQSEDEACLSCEYDREVNDCKGADFTQPGLFEFEETVSWPGRNSDASDRLTR